jgi:hypothetical protein
LFGLFMFAFFISFANFMVTYVIISSIHYTKYGRLVSIL